MTHHTINDIDPTETREWLDALNAVVAHDGTDRAAFLLQTLLNSAHHAGIKLSSAVNTPYRNTIQTYKEKQMPPDEGMAQRISALIRWNAVAMVLRAGKYAPELGGHIASYASAATLYETGFNHFFKGPNGSSGGDLLYIQGHCSPGIYARAFLEGRLSEQQLDKFRQEVEVDGLSSYPHPWLMGDFWQFPTVSMGLGPLQAIYQARFMKYLEHRSLIKAEGRKVWAFLGDGEMDEPESLGALSIAAREKLDNLIFVVNCNLQRLDGPVRGNGKIIQELEGVFRGAGWNVIKVVWGGRWDPLFAEDHDGILQRRMQECVDGDYQSYKANDGAFVREHFFGASPELRKMVAHLSDDEVWRLNRGGHDAQKVFAAYAAAVSHTDSPTVILAKTVKGYGMGAAGEGMNITHQQKKMTLDQLRAFRDRFSIPVSDDVIADIPFYRPADNSPEMIYLQKQREALGGYLPARSSAVESLAVPALSAFSSLLKSTGDREISTTMAFVRILSVLLKDKAIGERIVPIVPDECRTFGMEGLFRQIGIYSPLGQLYTPVDHGQLMHYHEARDGQMLEEGINEAGAFCSWMAAATSYSSNKCVMIPFYIKKIAVLGAGVMGAQIQNRACGHGDHVAVAGRQIDRRHTGIGRRVHPRIQCDSQARTAVKGARQTRAPIGACHQQRHRQQQQHAIAQVARIAAGKIGRGKTHAQFLERQGARLMQPPQFAGKRIFADQPVLAFGNWPVPQATFFLQPPRPIFPSGPGKTGKAIVQRQANGGDGRRQQKRLRRPGNESVKSE